MTWETGLATTIALIVLATVATLGLWAGRIPSPWSIATALGRATLQLAALSLVLAGVITDARWVALGLVVMFAAAVGTAARRARLGRAQLGSLALAMLVGPLAVGAIIFASGALEFSPRYVLAVCGIIIGNTMTIAILTERIFTSTVRDGWDEVEGWLALGATPRQSTATLARQAIRTALLPSIDQTRTTGIVVLPGAFVGAIFAGASPLEAGRFQLLVLAGILAAGVITATLLARSLGAITQRPGRVELARTTPRPPRPPA